MNAELKKLLTNFHKQFEEDFECAKTSGALSDGLSDVEIGRCVLQITAAKFALPSGPLKAELANLRHFV